ncbi:MAG: hypothetical protein IE891_05175 [Flavobacteriaceae bacterium]|nr:hypothetical protein [Flavobacteriaceae bacterium]
MLKNYLLNFLPVYALSFFSLTSCEKVFEPDSYEAYFGGEIINPQSKEILFLKDGVVIDTIKLDNNNRFLHKFDSLAPGLYTFQHAPEYQYIFFDKNDSLMIRLNTNDFDNSLAFCGRGDEKNNFLIDQFLKNEKEKNQLFEILDKDFKTFNNTIESDYRSRTADYLKRRAEIGWSEDFDAVAKSGVDLNHYYKKELYPFVHQYKTGKEVYKELPKDFYNYRTTLNFNNENLANFSPFIKYVTSLLNNKSFVHNHFKIDDLSLENSIYKLNVTDSLISNPIIKNIVLNNVAYMYLLEEQNMFNNKKFIDRYLELSTDKEQQKEVKSIYDAVQNLKVGNKLPDVDIVDKKFEKINLQAITDNKLTVIFFWSSHAESHFEGVHKKAKLYKEKYPNLNFVGININDATENWTKALKSYNLGNVQELKSTNFTDIKRKWVITKLHRTIILNPDGTIKNAFANLFDVNFEKDLK